eukprot:scaffold404297_cov33-Prasinocladus_malaysianus.AAC.1
MFPIHYARPVVNAVAVCLWIHQRVASLAKGTNGDPYILCGDFNIKPEDCTYGLITTGRIPDDHPELPQPRPWDPWRPDVPVAMKSAYKE